MIDLSKIEKIGVVPVRHPTTKKTFYVVKSYYPFRSRSDGRWVWLSKQDLTEPMTSEELKRSPHRNLSRRSITGKPLTEEELDALLETDDAEEQRIDWRPTETIPEDFYSV